MNLQIVKNASEAVVLDDVYMLVVWGVLRLSEDFFFGDRSIFRFLEIHFLEIHFTFSVLEIHLCSSTPLSHATKISECGNIGLEGRGGPKTWK